MNIYFTAPLFDNSFWFESLLNYAEIKYFKRGADGGDVFFIVTEEINFPLLSERLELRGEEALSLMAGVTE